jgi:DNA-directed RNA polymerase specialized sigma subunit
MKEDGKDSTVKVRTRLSEKIPCARVETWLESYRIWKSRVEEIRSRLKEVPGLSYRLELVSIHGKGGKNEAILNEVIKRLEWTEQELPLLELRISLVEVALSALEPEELQFIEIRYIKKMTIPKAMDRLGLSRRSMYYRRKQVLCNIYQTLRAFESIFIH